MSRDSSAHGAKTTRRVVAVLVVAALAGTWWAFFRPAFVAEGPVQLIVVSGKSMEPGLHTGDVAVLYRQDVYSAGDVVAYRSGRTPGAGRAGRAGSGPFVIHRIAGGNGADGFVMRGDNNSFDDPWQPTEADVEGEMVFSVPAIGRTLEWLSRPVHAGALLAAVFVTLVLGSQPRGRRTQADADAPAKDDAPAEDEPTRDELIP